MCTVLLWPTHVSQNELKISSYEFISRILLEIWQSHNTIGYIKQLKQQVADFKTKLWDEMRAYCFPFGS